MLFVKCRFKESKTNVFLISKEKTIKPIEIPTIHKFDMSPLITSPGHSNPHQDIL